MTALAAALLLSSDLSVTRSECRLRAWARDQSQGEESYELLYAELLSVLCMNWVVKLLCLTGLFDLLLI